MLDRRKDSMVLEVFKLLAFDLLEMWKVLVTFSLRGFGFLDKYAWFLYSLFRSKGQRKEKTEGVFATNRQNYLHLHDVINWCLFMSLLQQMG